MKLFLALFFAFFAVMYLLKYLSHGLVIDAAISAINALLCFWRFWDMYQARD